MKTKRQDCGGRVDRPLVKQSDIIKYRNVWTDSDFDNYEYSGEHWNTVTKATEVAQRDLELDMQLRGTLKLVRQEKVTMPLFGPTVVEVVNEY